MQPAGGVHAGAHCSGSGGGGGGCCKARGMQYRSANRHGGAALGGDGCAKGKGGGDSAQGARRDGGAETGAPKVRPKVAKAKGGLSSCLHPAHIVISFTLLSHRPAGFVEAGPGVCAVSLRAPKQLPAAAGSALRVLSYNILADQYAGSTFAQQVRAGRDLGEYTGSTFAQQVRAGRDLGEYAGSTFAQQVPQCHLRPFLSSP